MRKLIAVFALPVMSACASISGPCHIGPDSAGCEKDGSLVIVIKDIVPAIKP